MTLQRSMAEFVGRVSPLRVVPEPPYSRLQPTWRQASLRRIDDSHARAMALDAGGWYVAGASADLPAAESITRTIAGRELALWRDDSGKPHAGSGVCPHMGALLDRCPVVEGVLHCRWHGMDLAEGRHGYREIPALDDGVLLWLQLPTPGEEPRDEPVESSRPPLGASIAAVYSHPVTCDPDDVIANRLDPWHGAWFHPYAFSHLTVDDDASTPDRLVVDVVFRMNRTLGVPVRAEFVTPDRRTIVMRIIDGEGTGSVVETHVTPVGVAKDGTMRSMITEATIAYSDRPGFRFVRPFAPLLRPAIVGTQARLWVDDREYAERRYAMREAGGVWSRRADA